MPVLAGFFYGTKPPPKHCLSMTKLIQKLLFTAALSAVFSAPSICLAESNEGLNAALTTEQSAPAETQPVYRILMTDVDVELPDDTAKVYQRDQQDLTNFDYVLREMNDSEELFIRADDTETRWRYQKLDRRSALYPEGMSVEALEPLASAGYRIKF